MGPCGIIAGREANSSYQMMQEKNKNKKVVLDWLGIKAKLM